MNKNTKPFLYNQLKTLESGQIESILRKFDQNKNKHV